MVVEATLRTRLGVTAGPDAQVDRVNRMVISDGILSQRRTQGIDIEATRGQGIVEAAPPTTMRWLQAEMGQRADRLGRQQGVDKLAQGIGPAIAAGMQGSSEGAES